MVLRPPTTSGPNGHVVLQADHIKNGGTIKNSSILSYEVIGREEKNDQIQIKEMG